MEHVLLRIYKSDKQMRNTLNYYLYVVQSYVLNM